MSDYTAALLALTDEEQRLNAQDWRDQRDLDRLREIEVERAYLWSVERARRAGADLSAVPLAGYRIDRPKGWALNGPKRSNLATSRLPIASANELIDMLISYQEEEHAHAAD